MPLIAELQNFDFVERYDADGGAISVPATAVDTVLTSIQSSPGGFYIEAVTVSLYDPAAIPLLVWGITINGTAFYPYVNQKMPGGQFVFPVVVERIIQGYTNIAIVGRIPTTSPGPFDVVGRIRGAYLRKR